MSNETREPVVEGDWRHEDAAAAPDGTARYIADMTAQLARLARSAQLGVLAYLLDMAATEARSDTGEDDLVGDAPVEIGVAKRSR